MFDGFKIQKAAVSVDDLESGGVDIRSMVSETTGESKPGRKSYASARGLNFTFHRRKDEIYATEVAGSIHKFANQGKHNHDDFTVSRLIDALHEVCELGLNPFHQDLNNLEFGVNIELRFPVEWVLSSLIAYKGQPFQVWTEEGVRYHQVVTSEFIIKVYDKGRQYGLNRNLLRFEIKVVKMRYFKNRGIELTTLVNVLHTANYAELGNRLLEHFQTILFDGTDQVDKELLSDDDRALISDGRLPKYWLKSKGLSDKERKAMERREQRFRELALPSWHNEVADTIRHKWNLLSKVDSNLEDEIQSLLNDWNCRKITGGICRKITDLKKGHLSENHTLYIGGLSDNGETAQPKETKAKISSKSKVTTDENQSQKKETCHQASTPKWIQPKVKQTSTVSVADCPKETLTGRHSEKTEVAEYYGYPIPSPHPATRAAFGLELNSQPRKNGLYTVFLRISCRGIHRKIHTGVEVRKEHFNPSAKPVRWVRMSESRHATYNWKLKDLMEYYEQLYDALTAAGIYALNHKLKEWPALVEKERQKVIVREVKSRKMYKNKA